MTIIYRQLAIILRDDLPDQFIKFIKEKWSDADMQINVEMIVRLKELFTLHLKDRYKLGELIDKYLIPHDNEKRKNAEVSTPYCLRQEQKPTR